MNKSKIADLLEELIYEIKQNDELSFTPTDNKHITYVEGVIRELRDNDKTKHDGGMADDGE